MRYEGIVLTRWVYKGQRSIFFSGLCLQVSLYCHNSLKNKKLFGYKPEKDRKCDHIIFVDDNDKRSKFNASSYFGTPKELLHQKANRLKTAAVRGGSSEMK